mgnify:CR=1 FL=1
MAACQGRETITIQAGLDPVVFEVEAGYATNGKYMASLRLPGGWTEVGSGDVADDIPDRFILPADPEELGSPGTRLLVAGNYAPAFTPTGKQIRIHYVFTQAGVEVHRQVIERDDTDLLKCDHVYQFELEEG